jgi:hypothetical protein
MHEPNASTVVWGWIVWAVASCWLLLAYGASLAAGLALDAIVLFALGLGVAGVVPSALILSADQRPIVGWTKFVGLVLLSTVAAAVEALAVGFIDIAVTGLAGIQ